MTHPFFMTPEEMRAEQERQAASIDAGTHELFGWVSALDEAGLSALRLMLRSFVNAEAKAPTYANFYLGIVEALQQERHNVCLACEKNHDEGLEQILGGS